MGCFKGKHIGDNNLEMVFNGSSVFQNGAIDLIYVPFMSNSIEWKDSSYFPEGSPAE